MTEQEKSVLNLVDEKEIIEFAQSLIRARSDNPPGDTREVAQVCSDKFTEYGIQSRLHIAPPEIVSTLYPDSDNATMPSVIATMKGVEDGPTLLLNAHIDTVRAGDLSEWDDDPFAGVVKDGYIYGRGAGDDKGAVLAQVLAACYLKKANIPLKGTLLINPVADEEANAIRGTKWLKESKIYDPMPDMLIVGEQTDNRVACAERLVVYTKVKIKGRACHGAMPWKGVNATALMSDFIQLLKNELEPELQKIKNPYLPLSTASPTRIQGGLQTNIIPDLCELNIDMRLVPEISLKEALEKLNTLLQKLSDRGPAFEWEVSATDAVPYGVYTPPEHPLIRSMLSAVEDITGEKAEPTGYRQGSDGKMFSDMNIPIAIFGPSDPSVGHSPNECVSIKQLVEATKIMILSIMRVMGPEGAGK